MKIKEMIVDLTPLLDVILILLFMVLASQSQASDEKIVALETQVAQLEMTQVPGTPSEQAWYRTFQESIGKLNIVFPSSLDGQPMYLILEDGSQVEKPETLDLFSWLHGQVTSMSEAVIIVSFTYDNNAIYVRDYRNILAAVTRLDQELDKTVVYQEVLADLKLRSDGESVSPELIRR
ncbi:hypothetical protein ACTQ45_12140 [Fundicoccus sp. Sow4_D5]|uniref:hypothetical protein n=1 Tax=unclassified Fundicoccus TaxID=2761543 RepID=UPI003F8DD0B8